MENTINLSTLSTKKIIQRLLLYINDGITDTPLFQAYLKEAQSRVSVTN